MKINKTDREKIQEFSKKLKNILIKKFNDKDLELESDDTEDPYIRIITKIDIPNTFRQIICDILELVPLDWDNINYGNIRNNYISLRYSDWIEVIKNSNRLKDEEIKIIEHAPKIIKLKGVCFTIRMKIVNDIPYLDFTTELDDWDIVMNDINRFIHLILKYLQNKLHLDCRYDSSNSCSILFKIDDLNGFFINQIK